MGFSRPSFSTTHQLYAGMVQKLVNNRGYGKVWGKVFTAQEILCWVGGYTTWYFMHKYLPRSVAIYLLTHGTFTAVIQNYKFPSKVRLVLQSKSSGYCSNR